MQLDPFQTRAIAACRQEIAKGKKNIIMCGPCGTGKTVCMAHIVESAVAKGKKAIVYTDRKKLRSQMSKTLGRKGVLHGAVAAGHHYDEDHKSHVAMVQTVASRMADDENWKFPHADVCLVDEYHKWASDRRQDILKRYPLRLGFTATPVDIPDADAMVRIATHKELIESGRLVPIEVIGADEIDMEGVKRVKREYNMDEFGKRVRQSAVFGNVFGWWNKCNPWRLATIVFAPLVKESMWLVEQFMAQGVNAVHMDANTPEEEREQMFEDHKAGKITVISSPQLLTEGVDLPYVHYGILLRPCGPWSTFIQSAGRIGRASEGKSKAVLIDHVGATSRHGHPQADVDLMLGDTSADIEDRRKEALSKPKQEGEPEREDREPIRCPKCGAMRTPWLIHEHQYDSCFACGYKHVKNTRSIIMVDGTLKKIHGDRIKPKKVKTHEDFWRSMIYRGLNSNMTVSQMMGVFMREREVWPSDKVLPRDMLPASEADKARKVKDVYGRDAKTFSSKERYG